METNIFKTIIASCISFVTYHLLYNKNYSIKDKTNPNIKTNPKERTRKAKRITENDMLELQDLRSYLDSTNISISKKDDIVRHRIHSIKYPNPKARKKSVVFHGSPLNLDELSLIPHYHSNGRPVIFGATSKGFSLAFLSKWSDDDMELGAYNNGPLFLRELKPNAFNHSFKGKSGWLYTLDSEPFKSFRHLMKFELISFVKPRVVKKEFIADILHELRNAKDIVLVPYGKRISDYT